MTEGCLDWARHERICGGASKSCFAVSHPLSSTVPHPFPIRVEHSRDTDKASTE